jgi:hypothetical protein
VPKILNIYQDSKYFKYIAKCIKESFAKNHIVKAYRDIAVVGGEVITFSL